MNAQQTINKESPIALYYQVRELIRAKILSKEWGAGSRIPPEAEICRMCGVSRITVRKALEELQHEGYLERLQGKGTFVRKKEIEQNLSKFYSFSEELQKKGLRENTRMLMFAKVPAGEQLSGALRLVRGSQVFQINRARYVDGSPYAYEKSYIPCHAAESLTGDMVQQHGLYRSLNLLGVYMDSAEERFSAVNAGENEAKILGIEPHKAAIALTRTTYSGAHITEYCESIVRGDFFSYTVELR